MSVKLAIIAEPTIPSNKSWVIGAFVKPEASMLAILGLQRLASGVDTLLVFLSVMLEGQLEASRLEMAKSASPGREDAAVDPAETICLAAGNVTS